MSLIKKLASQTAIYGLSSIVGRLLNFLLVPLYTRVFLPEEYGVVTELYSYLGFLIVFFTYGMETAFFRYIKDSDKPTNVYSTTLISLLFSTLTLVSLFILFATPIAEFIRYPNNVEYVVWFALILGFDAMAAIPFAHLRYAQRPIKFAVIRLLNIALSIGVILFFVVLCPKLADSYPILYNIYNPDIGVGYIFIGNLVGSAMTLLLLLPDILKVKFTFDRVLWRKMLVYGLPLVVAGFAGIINEMLDRILLKYLLPYDTTTNLAHLGVYGACYKLSILMALFTQAFRYAAEPFFFAQSNASNAKEIYALVMKYFVVAGALIFLGITLFLDIFKHFIGPNFHEGLGVVPILLMANLCLGVYYNLSIWFKLTNKTMTGAGIAIFGAAITVVLNVLLIPKIGYLGSAWATLVCYATMVAVSYGLSKKHYAIPYNLPIIFGSLGLAVAIYWMDGLVSQMLIGQTLVLVVVKIGLILGYLGVAYKMVGNQINLKTLS